MLLEKFKCTLKEMNKRFKPMYACLQGEEKRVLGASKRIVAIFRNAASPLGRQAVVNRSVSLSNVYQSEDEE